MNDRRLTQAELDTITAWVEQGAPEGSLRVPTGFTEDRWVQAAEIWPGKRAVVHDIVVSTGAHSSSSRDAGDEARDGSGENSAASRQERAGFDLVPHRQLCVAHLDNSPTNNPDPSNAHRTRAHSPIEEQELTPAAHGSRSVVRGFLQRGSLGSADLGGER